MTTQTKTTWRKVKLGDVALEARDLYQPSKEEHLPYIGLEHIQPQTLRFTEIGDSRQVQSTKKRFKAGDVLFGSLRAYFRKVIRPDFDGVCSTDITVLRPRNDELNRKYLFYLVADKRFIDRAAGSGEGTRMPRAGWKVISKFDFNIPSEIIDQKRIADILSAFDDKIELNNKISRTLEQMAQAIFKEWFVNFRFPGHEKVKMVDSELGKIPEGWMAKPLDKIANFLNGLALQKYRPSNNKDVLPVIKIREMNNGIDKNTELASSNIDEKYKVKAGDVLFSWSGSLELMRWTERTGALNQHLFKVTSENYPDWFFYYWTQRYLSFFRVVASGKATSMGHIQRHHISEAHVIVPPSVILTKADEIISPVFKNILELRLENQKLAALRNLLLPKLMSGEIKI